MLKGSYQLFGIAKVGIRCNATYFFFLLMDLTVSNPRHYPLTHTTLPHTIQVLSHPTTIENRT
ncbi:uncharacterized protein DS421_20g707950 [Arachis hypogaea]|nr:uncharacterized protein DS421_20g707950 [Arachis hypogaea]